MMNWKSLRKLRDKFQVRANEQIGSMGLDDGTIDVSGRPGYSYVIDEGGRPVECWRENIPAIWRAPVVFGMKNGRQTIFRFWDVFPNPPQRPPIREHAQTHKYMQVGDATGTGYDWLEVVGRQVRDLRVELSNTDLKVKIYPGLIYLDGDWLYYEGTGSTPLDLASSVPVSGARYSLITIYSNSGVPTIAVTDGTTTDLDLLKLKDTPAIPAGHYPLLPVRLYAGQTILQENIYNSDAPFDPRIFGVGAGVGPSLNAVTIKSADYTLTGLDNIVVFTTTATATLPNDPRIGQTYRLICRAGTLTIDGDGSDTIKGETSQSITAGEDLIITYTETGVWE